MSILHGKFYNHFKYIRTDGKNKSYEARVPVLMMLISASDKRLQVWHGIESIMNCTGYSKTPVIEALSWLQKSGAIYNVPKGKRIGRTAKLHANRKVWQLTGLMKIDSEMVQYLLLKDDDIKGSLQEIQSYAPKVSIQNKPIIGLQDELILDNIGLQDDNNIGLQDDTTKELGKENLVNTLSAPKEAQGQTAKSEEHKASDKPKSKKERNRIFDGVAFICFGFKETTKLSKQTSARIGKIVKYIKGLEIDVTPEMLWRFSKWYDFQNDGVSRPKDVSKFGEHFELFLQDPDIGNEPQLTVVPKFDVTPEDKSAAIDAFKNKPQFGVSS